jgi:hypothetical protein
MSSAMIRRMFGFAQTTVNPIEIIPKKNENFISFSKLCPQMRQFINRVWLE